MASSDDEVNAGGRPVHAHRRTATPSAINSIPTYTGNRADARAWISTFESIASLYAWDEGTWLQVAPVRLHTAGMTWYQGLQPPPRSWRAFKDKFFYRFAFSKKELHQQYRELDMGDEESPKDFSDRFLSLAAACDRNLEDEQVLYDFVDALSESLRDKVTEKDPKTLDDAIELATTIVTKKPSRGKSSN
ncbi:hypothetical protein HYH03_007750 [Edaphochlamys debaryana]|uniref:Retrotransposon gag domain-containing protein n=1 Tax=Edaphochlamys debaryana TaxID=47281 RepID=A0A836BYR3_9CHLO|nr:hypothetical protein HYH03_007750 [Edaphochlamys debaryana]|eukprot:KAG2494111.1 hypothetical protein HYH03_007750 [Edaphochlamys debaryana]